MSEKRANAAISSLIFKFIESFGSLIMSFVVGIILARLLGPTNYGVLSMLTVFIAVSQVFVQSGLNTALIQKKEVDETDLSSVFYVSLGISAILYLVLFLAAPAIGALNDRPELAAVLRVLALILFPGALISVQNAVVAREMQFKKQMLASLLSTAISGSIGIIMAYAGFGYWALVAHQLVNQICVAIILLITVHWRPQLLFSKQRVAVLISYGWKLLVSSLLETGYNKLRELVIGVKYDLDALGVYSRGKQFPEVLMNAVNGSIQGVMLPVLSEKQDDPLRMKQMMRRSITVSSFLVLPVMAGLAAVAEPLIIVLLTDEWLACVPFLQICCIDFAFYPIHVANLQAINAMGRSDVFLKLEVIKKSYGIVILLVTVFFFDSVMAIAWGAVVSTLISAFVNASPNRKMLGYGYLEQMKDVLPSMALALLMFLCVNALGGLPLAPFALLVVQIVAGVVVYAGLALLLKMESAQYLISTIKLLLAKRKGEGKKA